MKIVKKLSSSGASKDLLVELESQIGATLPDDYRRFLEEENGGRPEPSGVVFQTMRGTEDARVRYFLTVDRAEPLYTVFGFLKRFQGRLPPKMVPIASDSLGNLFLLNLEVSGYGAVLFWDHELQSMQGTSSANLTTIAESFRTFVDSLE